MENEKKLFIYKNKYWEYEGRTPRVSVTTAVYNMADVLLRAMESVEKQSYHDFEYIVVDDGSVDEIDKIVFPFMEKTSIPFMYIKKKNGGVHTARNAAYRYMRGEFRMGIDADDELVEDAIQICINIWDSIPEEERFKYKGVVGRTKDVEGNMLGAAFPDNINELSKEQANKIISKIKAELTGMDLTRILKDNPMPEPEGITFVTENIRWGKLNKRYSSYFTNDMIRIYHTESDNSITRRPKRTIQNVINNRWNDAYFLNNWEQYSYSLKTRIGILVHYCTMDIILRMKQGKYDICPLIKRKDCIAVRFFYIPSIFMAIWYINKKM